MRFKFAVLHRFSATAPLLAAFAGAALVLSGCASNSALTQTAPSSTAPSAVAADAEKSAAIANAAVARPIAPLIIDKNRVRHTADRYRPDRLMTCHVND